MHVFCMSLSLCRFPVGVHRRTGVRVLLLLAPQRRLPVQPEGRSRAALGLSVSREGPGGGANGPAAARHNEVRLQSVPLLTESQLCSVKNVL